MKKSFVCLALMSAALCSSAVMAESMELTARGEGTAPFCAFVGEGPSDLRLDGTDSRIEIKVSPTHFARVGMSSADGVIAEGVVTDVIPEWRVNGEVMQISPPNKRVFSPGFEISALADTSQWDRGTQLSATATIELFCVKQNPND